MEVTVYAEASEMGWPPGQWPYRFTREGVQFVMADWDEHGTHTYHAEHDHTKKVVVFND